MNIAIVNNVELTPFDRVFRTDLASAPNIFVNMGV